jgi:outer membrane protein assembly factor BamE
VSSSGGLRKGCRYNRLDHIATGLPMPASSFLAARLTLVAAACAMATGCGSFDSASLRIAGLVTPYRVEIVQGNFVSKEQVQALKPGMSRQQVRDILGTPLVADPFHGDRWDYVFTIRRQGLQPQERKLAVYFKGEELDRFEGDEMPTEAEFVATLDNKRKGAKVPELEASDEKLKQFAAENKAPAAPATAEPPPVPANYPPLESR